MIRGPVILLLGPSGSGKSYHAQQISLARPAVLALNAGELLRQSFKTTKEQLRTASGAAIQENQSELSEALSRARVGRWSRPVLLEAHTFIDNDRELVDIPAESIAALEPKGILAID